MTRSRNAPGELGRVKEKKEVTNRELKIKDLRHTLKGKRDMAKDIISEAKSLSGARRIDLIWKAIQLRSEIEDLKGKLKNLGVTGE